MNKIRCLCLWLLYAMLLLSMNTAYSQEALIVHPANGSLATSFVLENIQHITFSNDNLSVKSFDCNDVVVRSLDNVEKITFGDKLPASLIPPSTADLNVVAYITPDGVIVVKSSAIVQSLKLFDLNGKILRTTTQKTPQTSINISSLPAGIYLLRIETKQGTKINKIIKK